MIFLSVSDHLPRLDKDDNVFTVHEELPDEFIISDDDTFSAVRKVKTNTSAGQKPSRLCQLKLTLYKYL